MNSSVNAAAGSVKSGSLECVEIYVPKKLEHMSELYRYLRTKLTDRQHGVPQDAPIDGFSMYEVDGAFLGDRLYQERTLVIRILFVRSEADDAQSIHQKILALAAEVAATIPGTEEELWICHYPQNAIVMHLANGLPKET